MSGGGIVVLFYTWIHQGICNITLGIYVRLGFFYIAYTLLSFLAKNRNGISTYIKRPVEFISTLVLQQLAFQMSGHNYDI